MRPAVSIGAPIRIEHTTGRTIQLPFRIEARPPVIATGTIGACAYLGDRNHYQVTIEGRAAPRLATTPFRSRKSWTIEHA